MQHKRILAVAVAATMLIGSTVTAFADDATGATGTGTSFDHVNKEITSVKLPTTSDVANVFNYYVDPERLINDAGTLADGTTAVTGNNDGVYFANAGSAAVDAQDGTAKFTRTGTDTDAYTVTGVDLSKNATYTYNGTDSKWEDGEGEEVSGISVKDGEDAAVTAEDGDTIVVSGAVAAQAAGSATYSSASDAVSFEGRNSVAVDVSVKAEIKEADAKETDIELVADADALAAATGPALLMQLKVGTDTKAVTSSGTTASATIDGKADNFEVKTDSGKYVYQAKSDATGWNSTTVQLIGKTNEKDVPTGTGAMTAPKITLTWTIEQHDEITEYTMTANPDNGNLVYLFTSDAPTGELTAVTVNGTSRLGQIQNGNISYTAESGLFRVLSGAISAAGITQDNTTILATIGGKDYTFKY